MTDLATPHRDSTRPDLSADRLKRRYRAETRFRIYGIAAIATALLMLAFLLGSIIHKGGRCVHPDRDLPDRISGYC